MVGKKVRIWPPMRRIDPIRGELPPLEYHQWDVISATEKELRLYNPSITQQLCLPKDHIREFRRDQDGSDGLFILKSQVILRGNVIHLEPLP
jgi:hypothetical protein